MQANTSPNSIYDDLEIRWRIMDLLLYMELSELKKTFQFMKKLSNSKEGDVDGE